MKIINTYWFCCRLALLIATCCLGLLQPSNAQRQLLQYVNVLTGTANSTTKASLKHGEGTEVLANTIPAVGLPFGMTQFTPQTRPTETKCQAPYYYKDAYFNGFRASHWLSGGCTQDYGSLTIMPTSGALKTTIEAYQIPLNHTAETATPNQYQLMLQPYNLQAMLTATARCGILKIVAQQADTINLLLVPNSDKQKATIKISNNAVTIINPAHKIYQGWGEPAGFDGNFYVEFSKPIIAKGVFADDAVTSKTFSANQKNSGAYVRFVLQKGEVLTMKIGSSFTSTNAAKNNLQAEIGVINFEQIATAAAAAWEKELSKISVSDTSTKRKKIFYTALFHALQHPRLMNDVDGSYPAFSKQYQTKKLQKGEQYFDDFSQWDIYRAQLPLQILINPRITNHFVHSMLLKAEQGGWLPIFPCWNSYTSAMVGDHVIPFIASAYHKGIKNFDVEKMYGYMRQNAFEMPSIEDYRAGKGRRALTSYTKYGYVPLDDEVPYAFHIKEQTSRTLEYAFDDYALATMAKALGKKNDLEILSKRGENYRNVFDSSVGFVNGRYSDGRWYQHFSPDKKVALFKDGINFITEGTPRQYTFYVPQNIQGLQQLMGGQAAFEKALDSIFIKNEYWHGNEPGHQIPFLYNYTKHPYKSQAAVHKILEEEYEDGIGGLSGNDDAGQMSAWYVWSAMGLYPVNPVDTFYAITAPLFSKISINTGNGKTTVITSKKQSPTAAYIERILVNGKPYNNYFISHQTLVNATSIVFELVDKPVKK